MEFQLLVQRLERGDVGALRLDGLHRELDGHGGVDGRQALAHADALDVVLQALAVHLALHFAGALEQRVERAELLEQRLRALFADAGRAGDVVDGVAHEREQVGDLRGASRP